MLSWKLELLEYLCVQDSFSAVRWYFAGVNRGVDFMAGK